MQAGIFHGANDVRVEEVPDSKLKSPVEAIVRVTYSCICGSDLWSYRGLSPKDKGARLGHEFIGEVVEVGKKVSKIKKGDFVIAPFWMIDGTCLMCKQGSSMACLNGSAWSRGDYDGGQGEMVRVPFADASLFPFPVRKALSKKLMPALLSLTDVMCTGHHAAVCAGVSKGSTVAVIGDGAVGLCAVLASKRLGAKRIIHLSSHKDRAAIGKKFGATETVSERGEAALAKIKKLTKGIGVDCVLECVGTKESWDSAFGIAKEGGKIGWVGIPYGAPEIKLADLFGKNVGIVGGRAPAHLYIPQLLPEVLSGKLDPSAIFDKTIKLKDLDAGYKAMDQRKAIKVMIDLT